jgi:hypothetical protein
MRAALGPVSIDLRDGWAQTTHDVPGDEAPFTLARQAEDACGAFQFSIALYQAGRLPCAKGADLLQLLVEFAASHELREPAETLAQDEPFPLAAATFRTAGDTVRVWYASDGASVVKATYLAAQDDDYASELADCEQMIRTISFTYAARAT